MTQLGRPCVCTVFFRLITAVAFSILLSSPFTLLAHVNADAEFRHEPSCASTRTITYNSSKNNNSYVNVGGGTTAGTIDPANMTPLDINVAFLTDATERGLGKFYGGAFFLALDKLNKAAAERGIPVHFNWTFRDTGSNVAKAMRQMADLYCAKNVSAFVGPDSYCNSAGIMATAYGTPYITFDCQDKHNETTNYLIVNTETLMAYVSRYVVAVLQHFKFRSFWLVTGLSMKWQSTAQQLKVYAAAKNISINGETADDVNDEFHPYLWQKNPYEGTIQASKHRTRVYVFLGEHESLVLFLRELRDVTDIDNGEYAVVAAGDTKLNTTAPSFFMSSGERINIKGVSPAVRKEGLSAFENVFMVVPMKNAVNKNDFEDEVYYRNTEEPINLPKTPPGVKLTRPNIPRQAYQLYDATMFYGKAVMALMETPGADPLSGPQIIKYLRCRHHDSIQGNRVWIHSNGETEGSYTVHGLAFKDGDMQEELWMVGSFLSDGDELEYQDELPFTWIAGHPPISDPACGFDGMLCPSSKLADWKIAIIVASVLIVVLIIIVALILGIRHYMYEQKLERLAWKIEREEIQLLNPGQFREMMTPARPRKKDSFSGNELRHFLLSQEPDPDIMSEGNYGSVVVPVGTYRGTNVVVKQLTRKHLELTRALKKQLQLRKELNHENINRFIGACIETPQVYIVTQYCPRKSLQDILKNDDSPLDDMFITSLVQDLIKGMSFIHESEFGFHGNLKSSNCLVDSRWTLKISDFGLSALGPPPCAMFEDEDSFRALLWTAPELLRYRRSTSTSSSHHHHNHYPSQHRSSTSSHHNNNNPLIHGSQKGDVYSFAIILYELYGKAGPWGTLKMTSREIIEQLTVQTSPPFRPDTSRLSCDVNVINLIQACWDNDPDNRPDFKYTIRLRFKPIQQGFLKSNIFDNMLVMMEKYANNLEAVVAERTEQLRQEKRMTENLLLRMLPRSVAEKLKHGDPVEPEQYEQVSIYFSDIVGFTELSADSTPMEVVDLLNDLYTCFDSIIEEFDVYKVETIGDAYMVVSGLPIRNGDRHAGEIASMSLLLLEAIKQKRFRIKGNSAKTLKIRIGIHSGPCCAGVVGLKMPRYCLFGDTVNTANRLESTGEALKIHCSADCKQILDKLGGYHLEERGYTEMKGKGSLLTYFLLSEDHVQRRKRISTYKRTGKNFRCVSASNLDYTGKIYSLGKKAHVPQGEMNRQLMEDGLLGQDMFGSDISSQFTSGDSGWSDDPEDPQLQRHHLLEPLQQQYHNQLSPPSSPQEYLSMRLPTGSRLNSVCMSTIDEDSGSAGDISSPDQRSPFPQSFHYEPQASETDSLLSGEGEQGEIQMSNIPKRNRLSSRSSNGSSNKTNGWGQVYDGVGDDVKTCCVAVANGVDPETVL